MIHGFGFGAALYYAAAPLATEWPGRVFSIDQLGCGLSSRPPWPYPRGHRCPVSLAEAYFVDAIEAWRAALSLDTIVLLGHSIGGYIAAAYAERHPERVRQLVLASPAGVPHPPEGLAEVHAKAPRVLKLVRSLVRRGWSPMLLTRDLGMGRRLLTNYMSRRFGDEQPWIAKPLLLNYLLGTNPLAERLLALVKLVPRVSLIYGEFDWINCRNGADVARAQQAQPGGAVAGAPIDVWRVAQGTHQHMIDNPRGFADAVLSAIRGAANNGTVLVTAQDSDGTTAPTQRFSSGSPV
jgi:cardiolipin-specific phospholipase